MKNYIYCFFVAGLMATGGCAWYNITPVSSNSLQGWGTNYKDDGYIIYQPELYFAVTVTPSTNAAGKSSVSVAPLYLPNTAKAYQVSTHNFLAKADFEFTFQNGWQLTQLNDKSDNSTVATSLAGQLGTVLSTAAAAKFADSTSTQVLLYKPMYDTNGIIKGFKSVGTLTADSE